MCSRHAQALGGESPLTNLVEVKLQRSASAPAVRRGLKEAWSKAATRRTGTG